MPPISRVLACAIVAGAWDTAQTTSIGSSQSPADATLERAASYLDNSSARLDELVSAIHTKAKAPEINEVLFQSLREFSQFHVTVGQLRIGKREASFATSAVRELRSQLAHVASIRNDVPPNAALAFSEAVGHLRSALDMVTQKLDSKSRSHVLTMGPAKPAIPGSGAK